MRVVVLRSEEIRFLFSRTYQQFNKSYICLYFLKDVKCATLMEIDEATLMEIATEMKNCSRLKDIFNFNVL